MNKSSLLFICAAALFASGCCRCPEVKHLPVQDTKTTIGTNRTWFTGEVIESFVNSDSSYVLNVKVTAITDEGKYPNLAVIGEQYLLVPNFAIAEDGFLTAGIKNRNLRLAAAVKKGGIIDGEMFFSRDKGWFLDNFKMNEGK